MDPKDRIIAALDVSTLDEALRLTEQLADYVGYFKVGLELLTAEGAPKVVQTLHQAGAKIFYDGKFDDIPNTVAGASKAVADMGVAMFNVHASAGEEAMRAAVAQKGEALVLAVTVLTSLNDSQSLEIFGDKAAMKVVDLAHLAKRAGVDGIICSPRELPILVDEFGPDGFKYVNPGIRPAWAAKDDQQRITTPADAVNAGANYLVIGRPLRKPPAKIGSPVEAAKRIAEEIADASVT